MTREEFYEWLDTCPTKWILVQDDSKNLKQYKKHLKEAA